MKKTIIHITCLITLTCFSVSAFGQQTDQKPATPVVSQNVVPQQKTEAAEPPKPIIPGGEQKQDTYKPVVRDVNQYPVKVLPPVVNDPVVRYRPVVAPNEKATQPKPAVQEVKEQ